MSDRVIKKESSGLLNKFTAIVTFLVMFAGAIWTASNTFAKNEDVEAIKAEQVQQVMAQQEILNAFKNMNQKFDMELNNLRIKVLKDKIEALKDTRYNVKKKLLANPEDNQLKLDLERTEEELLDAKTELRLMENGRR